MLKDRTERIIDKLQLGKLLYWSYFVPRRILIKSLERDPLSRAIDILYRLKMENAALSLSPLKPIDSRHIEVHFLTGRRFWYQTCFCAYSLSLHAKKPLRLILHDDGTLRAEQVESLRLTFPDLEVRWDQQSVERLAAILPQDRYPSLWERRAHYPQIRKLIDIHAGSTGWKLVLDSDMLFFRSPDTLIKWTHSPNSPLHMLDIESAYGYRKSLMEELAGQKLAARVNVGICGLKSDSIDWDQLERWCSELIRRQGKHYYLEQALTAMLIAGQQCTVLADNDYLLMPSRAEVKNPKAVLHHYVASSKPWYFRYGWKHIAQ